MATGNPKPSCHHSGIRRNFWKEKRVFVTGNTGFKGAWLTYWLKRLGADVTGFASGSRRPTDLFSLLSLGDHCRFSEGDVRDYAQLHEALRASDASIVFHLAAQPFVNVSYQSPLTTCAVNVMGTANLLEACRHLPDTKAIVVVTTDKCYRRQEPQHRYREDDALGGDSPYSASKAAAEIITASYRASFFDAPAAAGIASARAGNAFGGGDWGKDRLLSDAAHAFQRGQKLTIRNPGARRPWQYVLELLSGYLMLAQALYEDKPRFARAWNFGPPAEQVFTVAELIGQLATAWGENAGYQVEDTAYDPSETGAFALDSSLAAQQLGWIPAFPLQRAMAHTVEWYKTHRRAPDSLLALMDAQLHEFETF